MLSKLIGSLDFGKLTLDATSGFISGIAVLLFLDALFFRHLVENLASVQPAGVTAIGALVAVAVSYLFGILVDTVYHTFGRWFSKIVWIPLKQEFEYRDSLMRDIGLAPEEFEWVQSKETNKSSDVETKYMRYTEVAGSASFAAVLLAISIPFFMWREFDSLSWGIIASVVVYLLAVGLFIASSAALAKYEMNKTASAMDEIRSMSSHNCVTPYPKKDSRLLRHRAWFLFAPVVLAFLAIPFYHSPAAGVIPLISTLNTDNTVSSLQFAVQTNASSDVPVVMSRSLIITLSEPLNDLYLIKTGASDYSSLTLAGQPASNNQPWNLNVHLGQIVKANNSVQLSADFSSAGKLYPGDWSLPVYASDQNDGKAKYLLAYIKVVISPASTPTATPTPTPSPTGQ